MPPPSSASDQVRAGSRRPRPGSSLPCPSTAGQRVVAPAGGDRRQVGPRPRRRSRRRSRRNIPAWCGRSCASKSSASTSTPRVASASSRARQPLAPRARCAGRSTAMSRSCASALRRRLAQRQQRRRAARPPPRRSAASAASSRKRRDARRDLGRRAQPDRRGPPRPSGLGRRPAAGQQRVAARAAPRPPKRSSSARNRRGRQMWRSSAALRALGGRKPARPRPSGCRCRRSPRAAAAARAAPRTAAKTSASAAAGSVAVEDLVARPAGIRWRGRRSCSCRRNTSPGVGIARGLGAVCHVHLHHRHGEVRAQHHLAPQRVRR